MPEDPFTRLVEIWTGAAADALALLRSLDDMDWDRPTDLPGWTVRSVAAHLAHLESVLAGNPQPEVEVGEAPHVRGPMGRFTEEGPLARAGWPVTDVLDELERSVRVRYDALVAEPPADLDAPGPGFAGLIGWSWETLLSNRPVDLWMHEQDVRRAVGRPGGLETPAAAHAADVYARSLPYVVGKRVGAPPGTTVVLDVIGAQPQTLAVRVDDGGRGVPLAEAPPDPDARIRLEFESWIVLVGGRRERDRVAATCAGDAALADAVLANLAVTP